MVQLAVRRRNVVVLSRPLWCRKSLEKRRAAKSQFWGPEAISPIESRTLTEAGVGADGKEKVELLRQALAQLRPVLKMQSGLAVSSCFGINVQRPIIPFQLTAAHSATMRSRALQKSGLLRPAHPSLCTFSNAPEDPLQSILYPPAPSASITTYQKVTTTVKPTAKPTVKPASTVAKSPLQRAAARKIPAYATTRASTSTAKPVAPSVTGASTEPPQKAVSSAIEPPSSTADTEVGDAESASGALSENVKSDGVDWSTSFQGVGVAPFSPEASQILMADISQEDVEIKPDGIVYLPEIKYRRIPSRAFGPGGWGMVPRGDLVVEDRVVTRSTH